MLFFVKIQIFLFELIHFITFFKYITTLQLKSIMILKSLTFVAKYAKKGAIITLLFNALSVIATSTNFV